MDCGAAYMCIALSQILGFFFVKVFVLFERQNKVRLKVWVSLFPSNIFKVYSLQEKTFLSPKQAFFMLNKTSLTENAATSHISLQNV